MEVTRETFRGLRRAFALFALAKASHMTREEVEKLTKELPGFNATPMLPDEAERLHGAIVKGDVTCIVQNPLPAMRMWYQSDFGAATAPWGIWPKPATWRGTREPPKRIGVLTREEAIAKGIPLPDEVPEPEMELSKEALYE